MSDQTNPLREALRYDFRKDGTVTNTQAEVLADRTMEIIASHTPSSWWSVQDKPDPHGTIYDCERATLAHGDLTDDELANAVFLYDHRGGFGSIGLLTAAKDRIRWLSRRLASHAAVIGQMNHMLEVTRPQELGLNTPPMGVARDVVQQWRDTLQKTV